MLATRVYHILLDCFGYDVVVSNVLYFVCTFQKLNSVFRISANSLNDADLPWTSFNIKVF